MSDDPQSTDAQANPCTQCDCQDLSKGIFKPKVLSVSAPAANTPPMPTESKYPEDPGLQTWTHIRTDSYAARTSISLVVAAFAGVLMFLTFPVWGFADGQPISFSFLQKSGPDPGVRHLERKGDIWTEKDAKGRSATYKIDWANGHIYPHGDFRQKQRNGTIIKRISVPYNEYLFIPDQFDYSFLGAHELWVNTGGKDWKFLGQMYDICGYFRSYEKLECNLPD